MCEGLFGCVCTMKTKKCILKRYIVHLRNKKTGEKQKKMNNYQKEAQTKITRGFLDMIILHCLEQEAMHGYQLMTKIRKGYGVSFGPSTIYPLLDLMEKKGYVKSAWNVDRETQRKVYNLTNEGKNLLSFTENSLNRIRKNMAPDSKIQILSAPLN